jgi:hypothetical protein
MGQCVNGKYVWVTSSTMLGGSGWSTGLSLCNTTAGMGMLGGGPFTPWLSQGTLTSPLAAIPDAGPWIQPATKVVVATSRAVLASGSLTNPITTNELGSDRGGIAVWTGTNSDSTPTTNCQDWVGGIGINGVVGNTGSAGAPWTNNGTSPCGTAWPVYCFEQ